MADPKTSRLDLSTRDKATKALHDLHTEQRRLKRSNRDLRLNLEEKTVVLLAIRSRMAEFENRGSDRSMGSNSALTKYCRPDGTVRTKGEQTRAKAYMPGLLDDAPVCDWQQELQSAVDDHTMLKMMSPKGHAPKSLARLQEIARKAPVEVQRIFTDGVTNAGAEWIPDEMLPTLERNLTAQRRLVGLFDTMALPNKTTLLPFLNTGFRPYIKAAASADDPAQYTSSSMSTDQRTITATGFAVRAQVADDAEEDSLIAVLPTVRQELLQAIIDGEEDAVINGDTGTHQDTGLASWDVRSRWGSTGLGTAADHRRAWIGLRAAAMDTGCTTNESGSAITGDEILTHRSKLDSPHGVEGSLVLVTSPEVYFTSILSADDVVTVDKIGIDRATIRTGNLGEIYGMPIVISEFLVANLAATGLYTDGTAAFSGTLIVNKDRWKLGQRRGTTVEVDKDISRGTHQLVCTVREAFFTVDAAAKKNCHYAFNVSV